VSVAYGLFDPPAGKGPSIRRAVGNFGVAVDPLGLDAFDRSGQPFRVHCRSAVLLNHGKKSKPYIEPKSTGFQATISMDRLFYGLDMNRLSK